MYLIRNILICYVALSLHRSVSQHLSIKKNIHVDLILSLSFLLSSASECITSLAFCSSTHEHLNIWPLSWSHHVVGLVVQMCLLDLFHHTHTVQHLGEGFTSQGCGGVPHRTVGNTWRFRNQVERVVTISHRLRTVTWSRAIQFIYILEFTQL